MSSVTYADAAAMDRASTRARHFQPEIQGLRAISVLAVIWAHAELPGLPSGFTGVDVFFVISGFLITRLLLTELEQTGHIDLLAFWARRSRRLLPNALATLIATLIIAAFLFPGYDLTRLRRDVICAAFEVINFRFAGSHTDYFNTDVAASPLLHFWSLSVEEQFYAIWPLLVVGAGLACRRGRHCAVVLLALIWCASFAASLILTTADQPVAYFHTGTRCWQLATGGLIAAGWQSVELLPGQLRAAMASLGLAAISAGFVLLDGIGYPGVSALLPTIGAAALLIGFEAAPASGNLRQLLERSADAVDRGALL